MFESEEELLLALDHHDDLVRQCVAGRLSFKEFCVRYEDFYAFYALDGHESDLEKRALFEKHGQRIQPHEFIADQILGRICDDSDAELESYKQAGRFSSREAVGMLARVKLPTSE